MIILVVFINIVAASASLGVISYLPNPYDNNNNDNNDLFPIAHAQSSSSNKPIVILNLDKNENLDTENPVSYNIKDLSTNVTNLQGATLADKDYSVVVLSGSNITPMFTLHIPDPTNPNITGVKSVFLNFPIDSIETKPDGNKIYYGKSGLSSNKIGDDVEFSEGILIENGPSQAQLLMYAR